MTLGEKIQLSRKKKGMSQEDLANLLNVSRQAVQKWESDASIPELDKLVAISNMFEVSLDYLVKDVHISKEPEPQEKEIVHEEKTEKEEDNKLIPSRGYFKAIRILIWIGMFISPLALGGSFIAIVGTSYAAFFLLDYLITIPIGVLSLRCVNTAKRKKQFIPFGILTIIFVSQVAGVMMLASPNKMFIEGYGDDIKTPEVRPSKKVSILPLIHILRVVAVGLLVASIIILLTTELLHVWDYSIFSYYRMDKAMFESDDSPNLSFYGFIFLLLAGLVNAIYCLIRYEKRKKLAKYISPVMSSLMIMGSIFIMQIDNYKIHLDDFPSCRHMDSVTVSVVFGIVSASLFLIAAFLEFDKLVVIKNEDNRKQLDDK